MNGFAGFLGRSLRGFRLVEFGALLVVDLRLHGGDVAALAAGRGLGQVDAQHHGQQHQQGAELDQARATQGP
ncbi:MAG: hypothetical protein ACXWK0_15880, partial [Caulobacteraceae bacterium]